MIVSKKTNDLDCYEKKYDIYERAPTFEGPAFLSNFSIKK